MARPLVLSVVVTLVVIASAPAQSSRHNVVLITLDGARGEEIFGGLDVATLRASLSGQQRVEDQTVYRRFWAADAATRREKLMPFFWGTLMRHHGSIAGNAALGSQVRLTNRHWFSYPGYSEILVGRARDEVITSNDPIRNQSLTVLDYARRALKLPREGVAVFASWEVFNAIAESQEGAITINAGYEPYAHDDASVRALNVLQGATPTPWDTVRHDVYTARFAMAHLAAYRPQVLYLALGETDDWAHDGRYERVLEAYRRTDEVLRELWAWLESHSDYRGRTSMLLTTDHGRGVGADGWRHHGAKYPEAERTWMAFVSPHMAPRGEWRAHLPLEARQVPATLLQWLGLYWTQFDPSAGAPVTHVSQN